MSALLSSSPVVLCFRISHMDDASYFSMSIGGHLIDALLGASEGFLHAILRYLMPGALTCWPCLSKKRPPSRICKSLSATPDSQLYVYCALQALCAEHRRHACKDSCNAGLQRASEGYPHIILLVPHAWSLHALALLVKEAATIQDLWKPQRHSRHC